MDRPIFIFVIFALFVAVMAGFLGGVQSGNVDTWSPRNYTASRDECFVPPQGDPLYDAHYASNVNVPNCEAFKVQAEARHIDAETRDTRWNTTNGMIGVSAIFFVVACILGLLGFAVIKG